MKESSLWQYIRKGMLGKWHVTRIESSSGNGVPDVSYGVPMKNGWLELKYIPEWPKRASTKVKLPLRPEQKLWIKERGRLAGNIWVVCRIEDDFFVIPWDHVDDLVKTGLVRQDWYDNAVVSWYKRIDFDDLYDLLKRGC